MTKGAWMLAGLLGVMSVCTVVQAEEANEETFKAMVEANMAEELLTDGRSILIEGGANEEDIQYWIYFTEDIFAWVNADMSGGMVCSPEESFEFSQVEGVKYFNRYINPFDANLGIVWREEGVISADTAEEEIVSWEEKDGVVTVETVLSDEQKEEYAEQIGYEFADEEIVFYEYQFDAETYHLIQSGEYVQDGDGNRELRMGAALTVDAEEPAKIAELIAEVKALDELPAEEVRTITCVIDPGTENEREVTQIVQKGQNVKLQEESLNGYELYEDAEGTIPQGTSEVDKEADMTVYLIKGEE